MSHQTRAVQPSSTLDSPSLTGLRARLESLADPEGTYVLVGATTGVQPIPADGLRFASWDTARAARRVTLQYRAALRCSDPRLPHLVVMISKHRHRPATGRPPQPVTVER
jgi:hypothetical protein